MGMIYLQTPIDTMYLRILCQQLKYMGVNIVKWFESYLTGRNNLFEYPDRIRTIKHYHLIETFSFSFALTSCHACQVVFNQIANIHACRQQ